MTEAPRHPTRRGSAAIAILIALAILQLSLFGFLLTVSRDQDLAVNRLDTARAFYAAEAGANMAIRELMLGTDEDGDGAVGSVSDDDDRSTDPKLGRASFSVSLESTEDGWTLVSTGRCGTARRSIRVTLE